MIELGSRKALAESAQSGEHKGEDADSSSVGECHLCGVLVSVVRRLESGQWSAGPAVLGILQDERISS